MGKERYDFHRKNESKCRCYRHISETNFYLYTVLTVLFYSILTLLLKMYIFIYIWLVYISVHFYLHILDFILFYLLSFSSESSQLAVRGSDLSDTMSCQIHDPSIECCLLASGRPSLTKLQAAHHSQGYELQRQLGALVLGFIGSEFSKRPGYSETPKSISISMQRNIIKCQVRPGSVLWKWSLSALWWLN